MAYDLPLTFANGQTELATLTSQTANFTFNSDELTQALTFAWMDGYVVKDAWDSSTSFQAGVWQYAVPATISAVSDIYFIRDGNDAASTDYPERISPDLYEIIARNIQFTEWTQEWLNDNYTLYVHGRYKLQTTDNLPDQTLANYVLYLAAERLLNQLLLKKTFVFLTNDTTVAEIVAALKIFSGYVLTYKQRILRQWEGA